MQYVVVLSPQTSPPKKDLDLKARAQPKVARLIHDELGELGELGPRIVEQCGPLPPADTAHI